MNLRNECSESFSATQRLNVILTPVFAKSVVVRREAKPLNVRHIFIAQLVNSKFELINIQTGGVGIEFVPASALHFALEAFFAGRKNDAKGSSRCHRNACRSRDVLIASEPTSERGGASENLQERKRRGTTAVKPAHQQAIAGAISSFKSCLRVSACRIRHCLFPLGLVVPAAALAAEVLAFDGRFSPWQAFSDSCFGLGKFHYSYLGGAAAQSGALGVRR